MTVVISKKRDYRPHFEAMEGARVLFSLSQEQKNNPHFPLLGSILLCAFAYEGYLNFLGRRIFSSWESFERQLSWQSKTKLLSDYAGIQIDESREPFQTVKKLFSFRDGMAHPKPKDLEETCHVTEAEVQSCFFEKTKSKEEEFVTKENAKICMKSANDLMRFLFENARKKFEKDHPAQNSTDFATFAPNIGSRTSAMRK